MLIEIVVLDWALIQSNRVYSSITKWSAVATCCATIIELKLFFYCSELPAALISPRLDTLLMWIFMTLKVAPVAKLINLFQFSSIFHSTFSRRCAKSANAMECRDRVPSKRAGCDYRIFELLATRWKIGLMVHRGSKSATVSATTMRIK